jgi:hypothetical protein
VASAVSRASADDRSMTVPSLDALHRRDRSDRVIRALLPTNHRQTLGVVSTSLADRVKSDAIALLLLRGAKPVYSQDCGDSWNSCQHTYARSQNSFMFDRRRRFQKNSSDHNFLDACEVGFQVQPGRKRGTESGKYAERQRT